jgi:hypothetical protein
MKTNIVKLNVIPVVNIWKLSAHQDTLRVPRLLFCVRRFEKFSLDNPKE